MVKSVVFDMDGVLFDTEKVFDKAWRLVGKELNIENMEFLISNCRGLNEEDTKKFITDNSNGIFSGEDILKLLFIKNNELIEENGLPLKPGVYEILEYLEENNYKIALASSTRREIVMNYLKDMNIYKYFNVIITGDMITKGKPEPDIYLRACKELKEDPKECIAIEDSFNGIKSAYRAGMKTIMVPDLIQPTEEIKKLLFKKLDSLLEVKKFFEKENNLN